MEAQRNIRFWSYINGSYVKITLKPGQGIEHNEGGRTDEGYDVTQTIWEHGGDCLTRSYYREARDCDGRITNGAEQFCPLADLRANAPFWYPEEQADPTIKFPEWKDSDQWQRDHQAETAGY